MQYSNGQPKEVTNAKAYRIRISVTKDYEQRLTIHIVIVCTVDHWTYLTVSALAEMFASANINLPRTNYAIPNAIPMPTKATKGNKLRRNL